MEAERIASWPQPKHSSIKDYKKKIIWLRAFIEDYPELDEHVRWQQALNGYSNSAQSFKAYKSALCWHLRGELRIRLDRLKALEPGDTGPVEFMQHVSVLTERLKTYHAVHEYQRTPVEPLDGFSMPVRGSKRGELKRISKSVKNWSGRMLMAVRRTKYLDAVRVMARIGCRPKELVTGVQIAMGTTGWYNMTVLGAKVTEIAGQPWRRISQPIKTLPRAWYQRLLKEGTFVVSVETVDGLRNQLQRASAKALPGLPFATAYVFRHSAATRLRDEGFSAEEIGALLGHSAAETQALYGIRAGGKRRKKPDKGVALRVEVPRTVRPLDRSGLKMINAKKGNLSPVTGK
ncbi:hypothetical protein LHU53_18745 [Rhodoferax sp. U2-2l]|uniref:hypothetical protein n=1 Tax=Rhodoferax sp. U2-2l TaxID=2884000 RepID=UPI001D0B62D2|nr:hypothetical protein [Rhodoferax sp. U2-2l]MCB8748933.1 hypothetical protein [Rhodoferax sp. U2-2l]